MLLHNGKAKNGRVNIALSDLFPEAVKDSVRINRICIAGINGDEFKCTSEQQASNVSP